MMKVFKSLILSLLLLNLSLIAKFKPIYTLYNFNFGAKSLGLANSFTSIADDLTSLYYNPAGIGDKKSPDFYISYKQLSMNYYYDEQTKSYSNPDYTSSYDYNFNLNSKNINFLAFSFPLKFKNTILNFGISYYRLIPYSFSGDSYSIYYDDKDKDNFSKYGYEFSGKNGIDVIGFSLGFELFEGLSIGITMEQFFNSGEITYNYVSEDKNYTENYRENFKDKNVIIGGLFKLSSYFSIGIAYRTKVSDILYSEYEYVEDDSTSDNSCEATLSLPPSVSIGVTFKPFERLSISADYSVIYWSKSNLSDYYDNTSTLYFPIRDDFSFTQTNIANHSIGAEYTIELNNSKLFLRAGLFSFHQLFVDLNEERVKVKGYSFGLGYYNNLGIKFDLGFMRQHANWYETGYFDASVLTHFYNYLVSASVSYSFNFLLSKD